MRWPLFKPAMPEFRPHLPELLPLLGGQHFAHGQAVVDLSLALHQTGGADFVQLLVDRGAIRRVGTEQVLQFEVPHLEIGAAADRALAEFGGVLPDFGGLLRSDAELFAGRRIFGQSRNRELSAPAMSAAHAVKAAVAALTFAALAWRWMEAPRSARTSGELLVFALCALVALALYLLYAGAARGSVLAAPALLATFLGRPRPGERRAGSA